MGAYLDAIYGFFEKLPGIWASPAGGLNSYYRSLLAVAATLLIWLAVRTALSFAEKRIKKYNFMRVEPQVFRFIRRALLYCLLLLLGTYLGRLFDLDLPVKILQALIIVLLAGPARNFLVTAIAYLKNRVASKTENKVDDIVFDLLSKFSGAIIYTAAIIVALDVMGINIMPFVAGAGVAGIAVGFAAKDTLSNLIAGILLIVDRPFEIGDRIEVWSAPAGSATWGDVIDIGLRATKIKTTDNIVIIIPNNEIMTRDIVNYTIITTKIRVRINIGVAYDADLQKARAAILEVAAATPWIAKAPPPKVVVRNFGESSVDLQLRVWIQDARRRMDTISHITDKVKEAFDRENIEIPYPKRDIYITRKMDPPKS